MDEYFQKINFYSLNSHRIKQFILIYKIIQHRIKFANKVISFFKGNYLIKCLYNLGFIIRHHFKRLLLINYLLTIRINSANKISSYWKMTIFRRNARLLIDDKDENYLLYVNSIKSQQIHFTAQHDNDLLEDFFFDYSFFVNCFIILIPKSNKIKYFKGIFYTDGNPFLSSQFPIIHEKGETYNVIDLNGYTIIEEKLSDIKEEVISNFYKTTFKNNFDFSPKKKSLSVRFTNKISLFNNSNFHFKRSPSTNLIIQFNNKSILKPSNSHQHIIKRRISFGIVEYSY